MAEIQGKIYKILEKVTGKGRFGDWVKQDFVIETEDEYPKKVCFFMWGDDKIRLLSTYKEGNIVKVSFSPESKEYNEKWFTNLRAWKIETISSNGNVATPPPVEAPENETSTAPVDDASTKLDEKEDDLPF